MRQWRDIFQEEKEIVERGKNGIIEDVKVLENVRQRHEINGKK